ncbi:hypothetical protein ABZS71_03735 [Streptomyces sp. NPDC005393]|uniref:hypothetical protein n=1 Tax=Streptomyces sp. NPDC005393 TaxID=3157041 RepID=UPI0033ADFE09
MSDEPSYTAGLLLAAIRAAGQVVAPRDASVTAQSAQAAALAGRALLELRAAGETRSTLRLGWPVGNAPNEEHLGNQVPAPLPRLVTLVSAMCVKAAWPDPAVPLYPGQPFNAERITTACQQLAAHAERVSAALERILPEHGLIASDGQLLHLGMPVLQQSMALVAAFTVVGPRFHFVRGARMRLVLLGEFRLRILLSRMALVLVAHVMSSR